MINIIDYSEQKKEEWDSFIRTAKNPYLIGFRDFVDYLQVFHSDQILDSSLMVYRNDELIALLPANIDQKILTSHGGLRFGGLITDSRMHVPLMLEIFDSLISHLKDKNVDKIIYKCLPYIYHIIPAEEDRYALFRNKATLIQRDVATTIYMPEITPFQKNRRRGIQRARKHKLVVEQVDDFANYWELLEKVLAEHHNSSPTHSLAEIQYLHKKFPDSIKLFASFQDETMLAGVVIFETNKNVAHTQYIANSAEGKKVGALDIIFDQLINNTYSRTIPKKFFDFGTSTKNQGYYLNEGLVLQKEGFGGRTVVHDSYELAL